MLPDGAVIFPRGFSKKRMQFPMDRDYLNVFTRETCRAEFTHWLTIGCTFLFLLWNTWWVGLIMFFYSIPVNLPCIIAQRYNRPRLMRLLAAAALR